MYKLIFVLLILVSTNNLSAKVYSNLSNVDATCKNFTSSTDIQNCVRTNAKINYEKGTLAYALGYNISTYYRKVDVSIFLNTSASTSLSFSLQNPYNYSFYYTSDVEADMLNTYNYSFKDLLNFLYLAGGSSNNLLTLNYAYWYVYGDNKQCNLNAMYVCTPFNCEEDTDFETFMAEATSALNGAPTDYDLVNSTAECSAMLGTDIAGKKVAGYTYFAHYNTVECNGFYMCYLKTSSFATCADYEKIALDSCKASNYTTVKNVNCVLQNTGLIDLLKSYYECDGLTITNAQDTGVVKVDESVAGAVKDTETEKNKIAENTNTTKNSNEETAKTALNTDTTKQNLATNYKTETVKQPASAHNTDISALNSVNDKLNETNSTLQNINDNLVKKAKTEDSLLQKVADFSAQTTTENIKNDIKQNINNYINDYKSAVKFDDYAMQDFAYSVTIYNKTFTIFSSAMLHNYLDGSIEIIRKIFLFIAVIGALIIVFKNNK